MSTIIRVQNLKNKPLSLPSPIGIIPSNGTTVQEVTVADVEMFRQLLLKLKAKNQVHFTISSDGNTSTGSLATEFYTAQQTTQIVSGGGFEFIQISPAMSWTVNHNLGYRPTVQISSPSGTVMFSDINHISSNQIVITFNTPTAGQARCI